MAGRWGLKPVSRRRDDALARMDPLRFEALVAEYYRRIGYDVEHCGTGGSGADFDGGIDLKLRRGREYLLVQCKRENAFQVPHNPVHQLIGTIVTEHASGAIFINTGEYTAHARRKAAKCPQLQLIDGDQARVMFDPVLETGTWPVAILQDAAGNTETKGRMGDARHRGIPYRAPRKKRSSGFPETAIRLAAGLVFMVMLVKCGPGLLSPRSGKAPAATASTTREPPPSVQTPVPAPTAAAESNMPPPRMPAATNEISRPMSDAQLREWQRKNDESMRILEQSTPAL